MNLFDPQRNFLPNGHKTWQRSEIAIKPLTLTPQETGNIKLSMFLPIKEQIFTSKEFSITISPSDLLDFINDFILDPEAFVETHFTSEIESLSPEVRNSPEKTKFSTKNAPLHTNIKLEDLEF